MTGTVGPGPIGNVGHAGIPGVPGVNPDYKESSFYCKKSYGFFEKDKYYTILLYHGFGIYYIKSTDSRCSFTLSDEDMSEHFIWGPELRDKKIDQIFMISQS